MPTTNQITIVGNLTGDPELRYTPAGVAVANMRVAVNRRVFNRETNNWDDKVDGYFNVNVWRDYAEHAAESLQRGTRVLVVGRLTSRSYEDREGQTRYVTEIEAEEVCPSLRFAIAKISKKTRGGDGGGDSQGNGWNSMAPQTSPPVADDVPF